MNNNSPFTPDRLHLLPYCIILICSILPFVSTLASSKDTYRCNAYSIAIPEGYTIDSESIDNYISLYNDNISVGIRVENNIKGDDVSVYTEEKIMEIIDDIIGTIDAKAKENVHSTEHYITAFSKNGYPALYIRYENSSDDDNPNSIYIEQYIITTYNYIYKLVFYSDDPSALAGGDIDAIKAGFTVNDTLITHTPPADTSNIIYIFIALAAMVVALFAIIIIYIIRHNRN